MLEDCNGDVEALDTFGQKLWNPSRDVEAIVGLVYLLKHIMPMAGTK